MRNLSVFAAGSLRIVWPELMSLFMQQSGHTVTTDYGPAGLLLQRIEQGEPCHLFASANSAHPQKLLDTGRALATSVFTHNSLCLSINPTLAAEKREWLDMLLDPTLRVATSTPLSDPSGDYAWQLFGLIEAASPTKGEELKRRAMPLVGGPESPAVPAGSMAASWLLESGQADLFIGYQSYSPLLKAEGKVVTLTLPAPWQIQADYAFAVCSKEAEALGEFLLTKAAQTIFYRAGFSR
ncbi:substrate-binding domain-containing protein [Erwinia pyri]|uniref:Substrate-binding domain-containing protein n=1 Tax=Erwinia pyri TaxID=3062598 RepID=A0AA50DL30_9GAMM|nr:substrate-binding domain-containing protein [Erwinia sp. DE2]WLS79884.1 substrate-binding domain-containing protein [Erwinia sp. DE2]